MHYAPDRTAIAYGDMPNGITLYSAMRRLAHLIETELNENGLRVDLIHSHKMSTDGILGYMLARQLKIPLVCSIWGDADGRIICGRTDLQTLWKEIANYASVLFPMAPWTASRFSKLLGVLPSKMVTIPGISNVDTPMPSYPNKASFSSVFHLAYTKRKGGNILIKAISKLSNDELAGLDIFGGGTAKRFYDLEHTIRRSGAYGRIRLRGPLAPARVQQTLNSHSAFVMPSLRESFGMAFVEALFAGIPVLYPAGWAIDGFFLPDRIGYACQTNSVSDVLKGLNYLLENQSRLKRSIQNLQEAGELDIFKPKNIAAKYQGELRKALEDNYFN